MSEGQKHRRDDDDWDHLDAFGVVHAALPVPGEDGRALVCVCTNRAMLNGARSSRYWLDMGAADLRLLNSGRAPLLLDHLHQVHSLVGVVERAWIEGEACMAVVRFGPSERAQETLAMVRAGVLSNVSVGTMVQTEPEADGSGEKRTSYWRPYEVSLVTVPQDWRAGVRGGVIPERVKAIIKAYPNLPGTPSSWRAWAEGQATRLEAPDLVRAMDAELARLHPLG